MGYIRNIYIYGISINIHGKEMNRNKEHRPNGATAEGGRPIGVPPKAAPVFLIISYHKYLWVVFIYSWYRPYMYIFF